MSVTSSFALLLIACGGAALPRPTELDVTGCGETVPYWCGHVCGRPPVRCIPEADVGMIYCATF